MALGICLKKVICLFAELRPKIKGKIHDVIKS